MGKREIYLITLTICEFIIIMSFVLSQIFVDIDINSKNSYSENEEFKEPWQIYMDPLGKNQSFSGVNNSKRPFIIKDNTDETGTCYSINIGNTLILMWGDANGCHDYLSNMNWFCNLVENNTDKNILVCTHYVNTDLINKLNEFLQLNRENHSIVCFLSGHIHYYSHVGIGTKYFLGWPQAYWYGSRVYHIDAWNTSHVFVSGIDTCHAGDHSHSYLFSFEEGKRKIDVGDFNHSSKRWGDSTPAAPGNFTLTMRYPFSYYEKGDDNNINLSNNSKIEKIRKFRIWFSSDHHVDCDTKQVTNAMIDADKYFPKWNISCVLGDIVNHSSINSYKLWQEVRNSSSHPREDFYCIPGNHDK